MIYQAETVSTLRETVYGLFHASGAIFPPGNLDLGCGYVPCPVCLEPFRSPSEERGDSHILLRSLRKNIKAFGLLALSLVLGTFVSEAMHSWLDLRNIEGLRRESSNETLTRSPLKQTVELERKSRQ